MVIVCFSDAREYRPELGCWPAATGFLKKTIAERASQHSAPATHLVSEGFQFRAMIELEKRSLARVGWSPAASKST